MIDGLKIWCEIEKENIPTVKGLIWKFTGIAETGEIEKGRKGNYKGLYLEIKEGQSCYLIIKGSIHKYWHGGKNYSQFNYLQLSEALKTLTNNLGLDLHKCRITNLEFGVNLQIEEQPYQYYYDFILHKLRPFQNINNRHGKILEGVQCLHSQIAVKCYDKGKQYNIPFPLMRFEVKVLKMQYLKKIGIENMVLSDLLDKDILGSLGEMLIKVYSEIFKAQKVRFKRVKGKRLSVKDKALLYDGKASNYWIKLRKEKGKKVYDQKLKRFKLLQKRHGIEAEKHNNIILLIEETFDNLLNPNVKIDALLLQTG